MTTKTINLIGTGSLLSPGTAIPAHIRDDDTEAIYVSKATGVNKAIFIFVKNRKMLYNITS